MSAQIRLTFEVSGPLESINTCHRLERPYVVVEESLERMKLHEVVSIGRDVGITKLSGLPCIRASGFARNPCCLVPQECPEGKH